MIMVMVSWFGHANAEETICLYEDILNKKYPCDNGPRLKKELENPFFDLMNYSFLYKVYSIRHMFSYYFLLKEVFLL